MVSNIIKFPGAKLVSNNPKITKEEKWQDMPPERALKLINNIDDFNEYINIAFFGDRDREVYDSMPDTRRAFMQRYLLTTIFPIFLEFYESNEIENYSIEVDTEGFSVTFKEVKE